MKLCSLVIPCYNEQESIMNFYKEALSVIDTMKELRFEFIFIDDGSKDQTLARIKELRNQDQRVHYRAFSRNFGKEAALLAGMEAAEGDYVAVLDVDLQDPLLLLPQMYQAIKEGYDCAAAKRTNRKGEPKVRSVFAEAFYSIMGKISNTDIPNGARDYRMMTRQMVNAVISIKEYNRFSKGIFGWIGFRTKWISYENKKRTDGKSKWSFWKLLLYSIEGIAAFSTVPLALVSFLGIMFCFFSFFGMAFIFIRAMVWGDPVQGWPSLICIITMLGGIQLLCLGIIGYYLSKTYLEVKHRPVYIEKERG